MNRISYALRKELHKRQTHFSYKTLWQRLHLDPMLLVSIAILVSFGLIILYSASNQNHAMILRQGMRLALAFLLLVIFAQIPPCKYRLWAPWLFGIGVLLLLSVLIVGRIGKGAQRWLDLGLFHFQPSEMMKLATPMVVAWYFSIRPLPPSFKSISFAISFIMIPVLLIAKQPDLGTALLVLLSGGWIFIFAGINIRLIGSLLVVFGISAPLLWTHLHDYQQQRVLTFLNPERDPLGNGYHIIQSKIAIGSGGLLGKGWLMGSQSHLHFLPENATDFIFAVCGEEFGWVGSLLLLCAMMFVLFRMLFIVSQAQDSFSRLLSGGIALSFFSALFVNIGMVTGILPVVGVPLPLVSYGGTSVVSLFIGFGILMSIHTHRTFFSELPIK